MKSDDVESLETTFNGHPEHTQTADFRIVGIGCSAGGLDALENFFRNLPNVSDTAFIIIQHLDPKHESVLPELLQRVTLLKVQEVDDGMLVMPNNIYVIPPNKYLSILNGVLFLLEPTEKHGLRLPVDYFLRALAKDQANRSIGVILSGMGSDGMLGMKAIKEKMGLTAVQDPVSADADSMPRSAISTGLIDIVDAPDKLPITILNYVKYGKVSLNRAMPSKSQAESALSKINVLLRDRCGNDFSLYKTNTLYRRIERRTTLHQLADIRQYFDFVKLNAHELDLLYRELLIGVTNFFRDEEVWNVFQQKVIPEALSASKTGVLRAWVSACSSGEEAYSLAIAFCEASKNIKSLKRRQLQIYATDIDAAAIEVARKGLYPKNIEADVSSEMLSNYFVAEGESYRVSKEIRDMVIFATQNVIGDPPFTKLDFLFCRNLLIYFRPELQKRIIPVFHYSLNKNGVLVLGSAESVGYFDALFSTIDSKAHIYRRLEKKSFPTQVSAIMSDHSKSVPVQNKHVSNNTEDMLKQVTDQYIQQTYSPAAVLVNAEGDILYFSGRTGKYLEPAAGKVNVNIHAMAQPGLREVLISALPLVVREKSQLIHTNLRVGRKDEAKKIDLILERLESPELLRGRILILFRDVEDKKQKITKNHKIGLEVSDEDLRDQLEEVREALRISHEESQIAQEELKSANEELQSTNEELQSTNEELTTSKEEMQSMNEELQTVNAELQSKVQDLTNEHNDLANLLNSTEIAVIFLDSKMRVRRFTTHATDLFSLIPGDIGRPLSDLSSNLDYHQLQDDSQEVLRTLMFCEKQMTTNDSKWYRVRIMPYRTNDNVIEGVVITFTDITDIKNLELKLINSK